MQKLPTVCPALHELHVTIEHQYGVLSGRWARFRSSSDPVKPYPMESLQELSGLTSLTLAANDFCWVAQGVLGGTADGAAEGAGCCLVRGEDK